MKYQSTVFYSLHNSCKTIFRIVGQLFIESFILYIIPVKLLTDSHRHGLPTEWKASPLVYEYLKCPVRSQPYLTPAFFLITDRTPVLHGSLLQQVLSDKNVGILRPFFHAEQTLYGRAMPDSFLPPDKKLRCSLQDMPVSWRDILYNLLPSFEPNTMLSFLLLLQKCPYSKNFLLSL